MYVTTEGNTQGRKSLFKCLVRKREEKPVSLRDFHRRRDKILVLRRVGGFGDILMHRMIFQDLAAFGEVTFACPRQFHALVADHPFLHAVVDPSEIDKDDYGAVHETTTRCRVHENRLAPHCYDHRSDIWAGSCGVTLDSHAMHIKPSPLVGQIRQVISSHQPTVLFVHCSSGMAEKNLPHAQVAEVANGLRSRGYTVVGLHHEQEPVLARLGARQIITQDLHTWMATIQAADYVVTIDTAAFHYAGGIGKPMVGVFSFTDGKVYGKYFNFVLVQRHRDDGDWDCGPCFNYAYCPKQQINGSLPCVATLGGSEILRGFDLLRSGVRRTTLAALPVVSAATG